MKTYGGLAFVAFLVAAVPLNGDAESFQQTSLGSGARSLGMGEGGAAVSDGAESLFWTPAGIANNTDPEFLLSHTAWVEDLNHEAAAAVLPLGSLGVAGVSGSWQTFSGLEERDAGGNLVKKFSLYTGSGAVAYAHSFGDNVSAGASAGFQIQNGVDIKQNAIPLGAGILVSLGNLKIGISGMELLMTQPSMQFSAGYAIRQGGLNVMLSGGAILKGAEQRAGGGLEVAAGRIIRMRVGYMMPFEKSGVDGFSNLTAGIGLSYRTLGLDYAFLPLGELGQVHRIQVSLSFLDQPAGRKTAVAAIRSEKVVSPAPLPSTSTQAVAPAPAVQPGVSATAGPAAEKKEVEMEFVVPAKADTAK